MNDEQDFSRHNDIEADDIIIDKETGIDDSVLVDESQVETIKKLKLKLKESEEKAKEFLDGWQRTKADFINLRKRDEESQKDFIKYAKESVVADLIPVLDSFDLAFQNKQAWESLPKDWRTGIESIYNQFYAILVSHGVTKDVSIGKTFDPSLHEAVSMTPVAEKEQDHKIIEVLQSGYSINGKVVRASKVIVGEYKN